MQIVRSLVDAAMHFALPPRCAGCGVIVDGDDRFCQSCWSGLHILSDPRCATCGAPFEMDMGEDARCGACLAEPPPWSSARAAVAYDDISRRVALRLKYGRRTGMARLMARLMRPQVHPEIYEAREQALIVPVPLHHWRLWGRGFNQAALVGKQLSRATGIPIEVLLLKRTRATPSLQYFNRKQREKAVRNAFAVSPDRANLLKGKTVLLVDDVHTSGATARACTRALLRAGAQAVHLLCWARVLDHHDDD